MPNGVRDMGFFTAINLFLLNGMPSFPLPQNPSLGCTLYDDHRNIWIVWNGDEWVDVILNEHRCQLNNEKPIQD